MKWVVRACLGVIVLAGYLTCVIVSNENRRDKVAREFRAIFNHQ